ncbi:MAG: 50S ribosomal protein L19 [Candidatus Hydrogenedentota bacterium]
MNKLENVIKGRIKETPDFKSGDTVRVHMKVREGDKERVQVFEGVVVRRRGIGLSETFSVRKVSFGVGVEKVIPIQSPAIDKIEILKHGKVRKSRIYYIRERYGKSAKLKEQR